jgi:hypothetical protein
LVWAVLPYTTLCTRLVADDACRQSAFVEAIDAGISVPTQLMSAQRAIPTPNTMRVIMLRFQAAVTRVTYRHISAAMHTKMSIDHILMQPCLR